MSQAAVHDGVASGPWPAVELRELRVFLTVAQELHFGRAADRVGINRSRVSQIVGTLEVKVGGRLFDRTSRRVRLTPVGERLLGGVAPVYQQLERVFEDAREVATGVAGTLRIGCYTPGSAGRHIVAITDTFEARHPGAEVVFLNLSFDRSYLEVLRAGDVDMIAVRLPLTEPDVTVGPVLSHEERVLLVARDDPLAARESVSVEDYADRPVSDVPAFPREMMDAFIPPATPSGRSFRRVENRNAEEMLMRVALGVQVHPTVRSFLEYLGHPGVTSVPIRDLPPSETALAWLTANRFPKIHAYALAASDVLAGTDLSEHQPRARR
jgi:DNA-binding transcriptional LysR family regulator